MLLFMYFTCIHKCQSIVIGFAAALFALLVNLFYSSSTNMFNGYYNRSTSTIHFNHIPMLCATSIITASLTSLLLGNFVVFVIRFIEFYIFYIFVNINF